MDTIIALTGASGNMGRPTLTQLLELDFVKKIKILLLNEKKEKAFARKLRKQYGDRIEIIFGNIKNPCDVKALIEKSNYVLNLAAVIPPLADHYAQKTIDCNVTGVETLVKCIEKIQENQPKLVHISTVAIYGNRDYKHPWGRVGDPLISSVYDLYSATKIKGERTVLDSNVKTWVVLRQTGILHNRLLFDNIKDGLMFHTCLNAPIEWVTANDSALMMKHLIEKDHKSELGDGFWKKCYNIGGGKANRITGFETFDQGFGIIGGSAEKFLKPNWHVIRNFHCIWFQDSDVLNDYLDFQRESATDYWKEMYNTHKYFALAKIIPPRFISKIAIERLQKNDNAPAYWIKHNDLGKIKAYFGSQENVNCLPKKWEDFPVLAHGKIADGTIDYDDMKNTNKIKSHGYMLDHGYDESKSDDELDIDDMQKAAAFRGGKCLSSSINKGDMHTKITWQCHDGHTFESSPYCILKAGHWCPVCSQICTWDYDRLAKFVPFYAQVWYDTHAKDENCTYYFDKNYKARFGLYKI